MCHDFRDLMVVSSMRREDSKVLRRLMRLAEMRPRPWYHFRSERDLSEEGFVYVYEVVFHPQVQHRHFLVPEVEAV